MDVVSESTVRTSGAARPVVGLAGWLLEVGARVLGRARGGAARRKEMRVVETLTIGAKKQLVLVSVGRERFLVGTGADSVGTIVRVGAEACAEFTAARDEG